MYHLPRFVRCLCHHHTLLPLTVLLLPPPALAGRMVCCLLCCLYATHSFTLLRFTVLTATAPTHTLWVHLRRYHHHLPFLACRRFFTAIPAHACGYINIPTCHHTLPPLPTFLLLWLAALRSRYRYLLPHYGSPAFCYAPPRLRYAYHCSLPRSLPTASLLVVVGWTRCGWLRFYYPLLLPYPVFIFPTFYPTFTFVPCLPLQILCGSAFCFFYALHYLPLFFLDPYIYITYLHTPPHSHTIPLLFTFYPCSSHLIGIITLYPCGCSPLFGEHVYTPTLPIIYISYVFYISFCFIYSPCIYHTLYYTLIPPCSSCNSITYTLYIAYYYCIYFGWFLFARLAGDLCPCPFLSPCLLLHLPFTTYPTPPHLFPLCGPHTLPAAITLCPFTLHLYYAAVTFYLLVGLFGYTFCTYLHVAYMPARFFTYTPTARYADPT